MVIHVVVLWDHAVTEESCIDMVLKVETALRGKGKYLRFTIFREYGYILVKRIQQ